MNYYKPTSKISVQNDEVIGQIYMTYDYGKFNLMADNRNINLLHVKRLVQSFYEKHLISPIIVNEHFQVIDGQHRLRASIETGKPVYYFILDGYGNKEITIFNTNQKNWNKLDYLQLYCSEGLTSYLQFKKFMDDFPDFKIQAAERILTGFSGRKSETVEGERAASHEFIEGDLIIPDLKRSYSIARKIMDFKPFYKNFHRGTFVSAVMPLLDGSSVYNHKEMLHKLNNTPIRLTDCLNIPSYRLLLEEIYNYKRLNANKVSFKYE